MPRRSYRGVTVAAILGSALLFASCNRIDADDSSDSDPGVVTTLSPVAATVTTAATATITAPATAPASVSPPGSLVAINGDGDIVTMRPDGSARRALTDDGEVTVYYQPQWSPRGEKLAWAETRSSAFALTVFDGGDARSIPMPAPPFFYMWSPDAARIGVLHNAAGGGLDFEIVDAVDGASTVVAGGAPFFFSWSPDGRQVVSHVGLGDLSILGGDGVIPLGSTGQDYQAPSWTSRGIYHLDGGDVRLRDLDGFTRSIATASGPVTMVASPDGSRLAIQVFAPDDSSVFAALQTVPDIPSGVVAVLDVTTGRIEVASREPSFGYFWSPDGASLLILVPAAGEGELEWRVWRNGETPTTVAFAPPRSLLRNVLPFFDQYAQAWQPWAPDSSAFAFVGTVAGTEGVWVQEVGIVEPRFVIEGSWVSWSAR